MRHNEIIATYRLQDINKAREHRDKLLAEGKEAFLIFMWKSHRLWQSSEQMTADDMRALRKRLGMTQAQLAAALDLTVGTISNYEGGHGPYKIPRVVALACETLVKLERSS